MRYLLKIKSLLTAITQQLTYLYKMILPHRRMNTQRYQNGCACGMVNGKWKANRFAIKTLKKTNKKRNLFFVYIVIIGNAIAVLTSYSSVK